MAKSERAGMSLERLGRIEPFIAAKYLGTGKLPCARTLVWRRGELLLDAAQGMADVGRGVKLTDDAIFRIYSMTKPVTSIAFMMLVEEGLAALDDPVHRFIPEWRGLRVYESGGPGAFVTRPTDQPMRCVDLLRHTSGLTYGLHNRTVLDAEYRRLNISDRSMTGGLEAMIATLAELPLEFSPGEVWNYSVSTDVVAYLVEKISGKPFDVFLHERIFEPLKMSDTGFFVPEDKRGRFTSCYALTASGKTVLEDDVAKSRYYDDPPLKSGGGGLVSTAVDYLRFARMLLNGGELDGARIVAPNTLRLMRMNHLPGGRELTESSVSLFSEAVFEGLGFGLGFAMTVDQARTRTPGSLGEYFWGGMASTAFWVDPVEDLTCIFMTQLMPSSSYPIRRELRTLVYSALMESSAP